MRWPHPLWFVVATVLVAGIVPYFGGPIIRRHVAIREIERLHDPQTAMDERKAVAIAMSHFAAKNGGRPIDAEYSAFHDLDGFQVEVRFVRERDFLDQPRFIPDDSCYLEISESGEVLDIRGAP